MFKSTTPKVLGGGFGGRSKSTFSLISGGFSIACVVTVHLTSSRTGTFWFNGKFMASMMGIPSSNLVSEKGSIVGLFSGMKALPSSENNNKLNVNYCSIG